MVMLVNEPTRSATFATPERSLQQRMDALQEANRIRSYRAVVKREIKAGRRSIIDELVEVHELMATMKVLDLLLAVPKVGRVKAMKVLNRERISPSKTVGGLSERQRLALVAALGGRASGCRGMVGS